MWLRRAQAQAADPQAQAQEQSHASLLPALQPLERDQSPLPGAAGAGAGDSGEAGSGDVIAPVRLPSREEMMAQDVFNNCAVRSLVSGVMGGGMGVMMGMLFGALDQPLHAEEMSVRQHLVYGFRQMGSRSWHMARTFAVMGAIFSVSECLVEKARAKHDEYNTLAAGCITGGVLSAQAGPQAACIGCAGFAAFSLAIEKVLERYH